MIWQYLFLTLFLLPRLIWGFDEHESSQIQLRIKAEWDKHTECVKQFQSLDATDQEKALLILNNAISSCEKAIKYCDQLLNDIARQPKKKAIKPWRVELKSICEQYKQNLITEIEAIRSVTIQIEGNIVVDKAATLYQESIKKADLAALRKTSLHRSLHDINGVISELNAIATDYDSIVKDLNIALALIAPYLHLQDCRDIFNDALHKYQALANQYRQESIDWPLCAQNQTELLKQHLILLKEEADLFNANGLHIAQHETEIEMLAILAELAQITTGVEAAEFRNEWEGVQQRTDSFEEPQNDVITLFEHEEQERKDDFFKDAFLMQSLPCTSSFSNIIPLDGQREKDKHFVVYTEQFYRFFIKQDRPISELHFQVYEEEQLIHTESVALPFSNARGWENYLKNGLIFIPETQLQACFGLDLRFNFVYDSSGTFLMILSQRGNNPRYRLIVSLGDQVLYQSRFVIPPPWQLEALRTPSTFTSFSPIKKEPPPHILLTTNQKKSFVQESLKFPTVDSLIDELKNDPMAIAQYVQHEIAFVDPFCEWHGNTFYASPIHRSPYVTLMEQQGSAWEQCNLLVYMLRKAGYKTFYFLPERCSLPKDSLERLLFMKISHHQKEVSLQYPGVVFFDGNEWISLFPWMKEIEVHEGYDIYHLLPNEYASAGSWILHYLKNDPNILKHIGSDGDDSAGILFQRFAEEYVQKQGLSMHDVGIQRTQLKRAFASWNDFPRPKTPHSTQVISSLSEIPNLLATVKIEISSNNQHLLLPAQSYPLINLGGETNSISFTSQDDQDFIHLHLPGNNVKLSSKLNPTDNLFNIKIDYSAPLQRDCLQREHTFTFSRGTAAALCFQFGATNAKLANEQYDRFSKEKQETNRLTELLGFVGASYFEKCSRAAHTLALLHKMPSPIYLAFGLSKMTPKEDSLLPQVDMFLFNHSQHLNRSQCGSLILLDSSSNEHQVLRDIFDDPHAVSTTKLLQIAHKENGGFLTFTASNFEMANQAPEAAQTIYSSNIKDLNLRELPNCSPEQWKLLQKTLDSSTSLGEWSQAYITPGLIANKNDSYEEIAAFIFSPTSGYALISSNHLVMNGGLGSPLSDDWMFFLSQECIYDDEGRSIQYATSLPALAGISYATAQSDVRLEHKSIWQGVADPVDTITGAFYVDEIDLALPGPFPLTIRRNYNSQNPLPGNVGIGWKLSFNPFLIEQDGKRFIAELDGSMIAYRYNEDHARWEIFPEDNPDLFNLGNHPFAAYMQDNTLYGNDGSKRLFENGYLKQWIDAQGTVLSFVYEKDRLTRIESSYGNFCGFHYHYNGFISEIYAKDGRRVTYEYNSQGDLIRVTLPNTATITYEYDKEHRIIRETRPNDKVLENTYDVQGRVMTQRTPSGPRQEMVITATFEYADGVTKVMDAGGGTTIYKIFNKQIYHITDPLGATISQTWFIDEYSWFDPEIEQIQICNETAGSVRALKSMTDKRGLVTSYGYDRAGNCILETLEGTDLTGSEDTSMTKTLVYNDKHLCIENEVNGHRTFTHYDDTYPYLPKRIEIYIENELLSFSELTYNMLGQLVQENHNEAITLWQYNAQGLPSKSTHKTGTNDPDVVREYIYNPQGKHIKIIASDSIQEIDYDIMGNEIASKIHSPSKKLITATYTGYNLNQDITWKQTANTDDITFIDYNADGRIKAIRKSLGSGKYAYSLYDYDTRGYLIEETDPRGYSTYRDYNALGQIIAENKEGISTHFSYEPGGLLKSITSPSGAETKYEYTANGLLKAEYYPDDTESHKTYDLFGRMNSETKNGITRLIQYDDVHHRIIYINAATGIQEIHELDSRGNVIRLIDPLGYVTNTTYDHLNRMTSETTPTGRQTTWSYQNNKVICSQPNGEIVTNVYEGGNLVLSETINTQGSLIAKTGYAFDPIENCETITQGNLKTITWKNNLRLPIKVQQGDLITTYQYDACGNCILSKDGSGYATNQQFDGLARLVQKQLPDGTILSYVYDSDSNLIEYQLPNKTTWHATYDSMKRKKSEYLQAKSTISNLWNYEYNNGYLTKTVDPSNRQHSYSYNARGLLIHETIEKNYRSYNYDARGFLVSAIENNNDTDSAVERSYDPDGRLISESIFLNDTLIQETQQTWNTSGRSLQIGSHERSFVYENQRLTHLKTLNLALNYTYNQSGALINKQAGHIATHIDYNTSGLPKIRTTNLEGNITKEQLSWTASGRLAGIQSSEKQEAFTYNSRGYLISTESEQYKFDFEKVGTGVRTAANTSQVAPNGLDDFSRMIRSIEGQTTVSTVYDAMGQVIVHSDNIYKWDTWGRLISIHTPFSQWTASYDAFGRRLQTRYTTDDQTSLTTSFYDPAKQFQEIGVKCNEKTFWKLYGASNCDAIEDETGASAILIHDSLEHLTQVVTPHQTYQSRAPPSPYGPQAPPEFPNDLVSYAQSLNWHSSSQDPTGLIWLGKRHYNPITGRFLSPDSVSYPYCLDLYTYANGDPVNYIDPDGRFASAVYNTAVYGETYYREALNDVAADYANRKLTNSGFYSVGEFRLAKGAIGLTNGIDTFLITGLSYASILSKYADGACVDLTYNQTHGPAVDCMECLVGYYGFHTPPVQYLKNKWELLIAMNEPDVKFLEFAHSGGAIHLLNALLSSPESVRQRIIAVGIAPAVIIPEKLCYKSYNYKSWRDFVTFCNVSGCFKYWNELTILDPAPGADLLDHGLLSKTFAPTIKEIIDGYLKTTKGIK